MLILVFLAHFGEPRFAFEPWQTHRRSVVGTQVLQNGTQTMIFKFRFYFVEVQAFKSFGVYGMSRCMNFSHAG